MATSEKLPLLTEGKTKKIFAHPHDDRLVHIVAKDDITAGNGARHDVIPGKGSLATRTTCNVFRLLEAADIPVAFMEQIDDVTFSAERCDMLPYEVVVRREAHGSYLKREPSLSKGHRFDTLLVEFFLKTNGKKWREHNLPCDDPLMHFNPKDGSVDLYIPNQPMDGQVPFLTLERHEVFTALNEWEYFAEMATIATCTFVHLENAWKKQGGRLVDFKVEFGINEDCDLLLADVIDNDSWRVVDEREGGEGRYLDKQRYRDGDGVDDVERLYIVVAGLTDGFTSA